MSNDKSDENLITGGFETWNDEPKFPIRGFLTVLAILIAVLIAIVIWITS